MWNKEENQDDVPESVPATMIPSMETLRTTTTKDHLTSTTKLAVVEAAEKALGTPKVARARAASAPSVTHRPASRRRYPARTRPPAPAAQHARRPSRRSRPSTLVSATTVNKKHKSLRGRFFDRPTLTNVPKYLEVRDRRFFSGKSEEEDESLGDGREPSQYRTGDVLVPFTSSPAHFATPSVPFEITFTRHALKKPNKLSVNTAVPPTTATLSNFLIEEFFETEAPLSFPTLIPRLPARGTPPRNPPPSREYEKYAFTNNTSTRRGFTRFKDVPKKTYRNAFVESELAMSGDKPKGGIFESMILEWTRHDGHRTRVDSQDSEDKEKETVLVSGPSKWTATQSISTLARVDRPYMPSAKDEERWKRLHFRKGKSWHTSVISHGSEAVGLGPRVEGPERSVKVFAVDGSTATERQNERGARVQHSIDSGTEMVDKLSGSARGGGTNSPLGFNFRSRFIKKEPPTAPVAGSGPHIDTEAFIPNRFIPEQIPTTTRRPPPTTTTRFTFAPPRSALVPISPLPPRAPAQCGVAPQFVPCLSAAKASETLLRCCKAKGLPQGCQDLCRYDITQAEVKAAMDAGRCGLLSVQPYLECASQGRDNTECCKHRGIAAKRRTQGIKGNNGVIILCGGRLGKSTSKYSFLLCSGPQCEDLCRSTQFKPLGLQHIVCGTVIRDLLQCHHSGVRE